MAFSICQILRDELVSLWLGLGAAPLGCTDKNMIITATNFLGKAKVSNCFIGHEQGSPPFNYIFTKSGLNGALTEIIYIFCVGGNFILQSGMACGPTIRRTTNSRVV